MTTVLTTFLDALKSKIAVADGEIDAVVEKAIDRAGDDGEPNLEEDEKTYVGERRAAIERMSARLTEYGADATRRDEMETLTTGLSKLRGQPAAVDTKGGAVIRREPRVYDKRRPLARAETQRPSFIRDLAAYCGLKVSGAPMRDSEDSIARMERHLTECRTDGITPYGHPEAVPAPGALERATTTASYGDVPTLSAGALMPTSYRPDLFAPGLYGGRVTADLCNRYSLPAMGMSISMPRITTKAAAGTQVTEATALTDSSPATTELELGVSTIGGSIDVSYQAIERGNMVESLIMDELRMALDTHCNNQVLYGTGSGNQLAGIIGVTRADTVFEKTVATVTAAKLYQVIILTNAKVAEKRLMAPTVCIGAPRRWAALSGAVDSTGRPLWSNQLATAQNVYAMGELMPANLRIADAVGGVQGLPFVVDPLMPVNFNDADAMGTGGAFLQDRLIIANRRDLLLFERDGPMMLRFEQSKSDSLQFELIGYTYVAFTSSRYVNGIGVIKRDLVQGELDIDLT